MPVLKYKGKDGLWHPITGTVPNNTDYNKLENKPQIDGVELTGNKTLEQLNIVRTELGKGLSTNDFTDELKKQIESNTQEISTKLPHSVVVVNSDNITQQDANDVLQFHTDYSGNIIEFISMSLSKTIGWGWIISNKDLVLVTIDYNGTLTQWHNGSCEKHNVESYSYINEVIDCDNLTVDIAGNPPFIASIQNAFNRPFPKETSTKGKIIVIPYSIDCQIQMYIDMVSKKMYSRLIEGLSDKHTFKIWEPIGGGDPITAVSNAVSGTQLTTTITKQSGGTVVSTPVELPSGGGEKPWKLITDRQMLQSDVSVEVNACDDGSPFNFEELLVIFYSEDALPGGLDIRSRADGVVSVRPYAIEQAFKSPMQTIEFIYGKYVPNSMSTTGGYYSGMCECKMSTPETTRSATISPIWSASGFDLYVPRNKQFMNKFAFQINKPGVNGWHIRVEGR